MSFNDHILYFEQRDVQEWRPGDMALPGRALRISVDLDTDELGEQLVTQLAATDRAGEIEALVIGEWSSELEDASSGVVAALVACRREFRALREIFLGEITRDETDISSICQCDLSPLLEAYPALEVLYVRSGYDLSFGESPAHPALRTLVVQSGGLDSRWCDSCVLRIFPRSSTSRSGSVRWGTAAIRRSPISSR